MAMSEPFTETFDTRRLLAHAAEQARERGFDRFPIVDVDAHHYESESWPQIVRYIENPVIRERAVSSGQRSQGSNLLARQVGNQDMSGRVTRYQLRKKEATEPGTPRDVVVVRRAMEQMGLDYVLLFPTPMLHLGLHPEVPIEVALARAYARWMTEEVLPADRRIRTLMYLPFNDADASLRMIGDFGEDPGVAGFMVTSVRDAPVHDRRYAKVYRALEERGLPLAFHGGFNWGEQVMRQFNRFLAVHAIGFTLYNIVHLTNWVVNGLSEVFPGLRVIWMESGLAWVPFLMQRLDNEYMMRTSDAPKLKRLPSEYIRECYFSSQPLEHERNARALELTFEMIDAPRRLLYASDYPHWDFDLPSRIYDLPFLSEVDKRRILGGNALELFRLPLPERYAQAGPAPAEVPPGPAAG